MADTYPETGAEGSSAAANKAENTEPDAKLAAYWREIARYDKATEQWRQDGETIVKLYLDDSTKGSTTRKFPLLWANVETLKPAIYAKLPVVQCSRRFKDRDPSGRIAAEILERCANTTFDLYNVDEVLRMVRDDRLLPGRGQAWVRYEASFETVEPETEAETAAEPGEEPYEKLTGESVCVDYVHWQDFGHSLARTWRDVRMVWRRVYKTRDECTERFGKEKADRLVYNPKAPDENAESGYKAAIYEIWDKSKGKVVWIAKEYPRIVEEGPPPLDFMGFFPCPEPCYATKTSQSLIPTPDYRYYRDQAKEINDLTQKIASLTDWLKLQGFVPAAPSAEGPDAVKKLVERISNPDAILVEVESWAAFTEKGGAGKIIDWMPVQDVAVALREAITTRAQLIQDVFQITGISDILRGQTDPNETLGAQELKAQTGSRRLKNARDEIVRFSRDLTRLVCEVIAEQFQPETLAAMSGFKYMPAQEPGMIAAPPSIGSPMGAGPAAPPAVLPGGLAAPGGPPMAPHVGGPPPMMGQGPAMDAPEQAGVFDDAVVQLLRDDRARGFRIDIETDSTIQPDENQEKQSRIEFLTAVGQFVNQTREVGAAMPALMPVLGKSLLFLVRGFRAGRELEDDIERAVSGMQQQIQMQMQQPKQDPETVKAQAKAEIDKQLAGNDIQIAQEKAASDRKIAQDNALNDRNIKLLAAHNDMKIQTMKGTQEVAHKERAASQDMEIAKGKASDERVQKQLTHATELKGKEEGAAQDREIKKAAGEQKAEKASSPVKLSVGDAIGKEVVNAVSSGMKDVGPGIVGAIADGLKPVGAEIGKSIAEALSKVTLRQAPRVRKPKYDKAGNITEMREEDAPETVQ